MTRHQVAARVQHAAAAVHQHDRRAAPGLVRARRREQNARQLEVVCGRNQHRLLVPRLGDNAMGGARGSAAAAA
jgi:hypothetical protein